MEGVCNLLRLDEVLDSAKAIFYFHKVQKAMTTQNSKTSNSIVVLIETSYNAEKNTEFWLPYLPLASICSLYDLWCGFQKIFTHSMYVVNASV